MCDSLKYRSVALQETLPAPCRRAPSSSSAPPSRWSAVLRLWPAPLLPGLYLPPPLADSLCCGAPVPPLLTSCNTEQKKQQPPYTSIQLKTSTIRPKNDETSERRHDVEVPDEPEGLTYCCRAFSFCWYISTMISFFCLRILSWFSMWLLSLFRAPMVCSSSWCFSDKTKHYRDINQSVMRLSFTILAIFLFVWRTFQLLPGLFFIQEFCHEAISLLFNDGESGLDLGGNTKIKASLHSNSSELLNWKILPWKHPTFVWFCFL